MSKIGKSEDVVIENPLPNGKLVNESKKKINQSQKKSQAKEQNKKKEPQNNKKLPSGNENKNKEIQKVENKNIQKPENKHRKNSNKNGSGKGSQPTATVPSTSKEGKGAKKSDCSFRNAENSEEKYKVAHKTFLYDITKLKKEGIYPLKKKSQRFPKAKFFCRLCDYHCDTVEISERHLKDYRHLSLKELKLLEKSLSALPQPSSGQYEAISELLEQIAKKHTLSDDDIVLRLQIKETLEKELKQLVPGASLEVTGSTLSKFALNSSNFNLDVVVPETEKPSSGLLAVKKYILDTPNKNYIKVSNDLFSSYPSISITHKNSGVRVVIGVSCPPAKQINTLLRHYFDFDERARKLIIAFKYWAKLCQIDNQQLGSLPSHCFPIMAIHFLQQIKPPVLPVLHELRDSDSPTSYLLPEEISPPWVSQNKSSIGKLWVDMFRFYAVEYRISVNVINIRSSELIDRKESKWGKKMVIEDPFQIKRNMTHTVSSSAVYDYIYNRFKTTFRYFVVPQMKFGALFRSLKLNKKIKEMPLINEEDFKEEEEEAEETVEDENESEEDRQLRELNEKLQQAEISNQNKADKDSQNGENEETKDAMEEKAVEINIEDLKEPLASVTMATAEHLMKQCKKEMFKYQFSESNFTDGKEMPLYCTVCQTSGHTKLKCVEDELPSLDPLPRLHVSYLDRISSMFLQLKNECSPKPSEVKSRDQMVNDLQDYIEKYFPGAILKLFGSSANGFGFSQSDLDICLTFEGHPTGEGIDHIKVIEELADHLKNFRECRHVLAITTAKVPIVKFMLRRAQLEADLSLYNTLALQNTKLLKTYTSIDERVKVLGYTMKYFAKLCGIGDASRGSLSSYAYILMVIHFLQQCKPPVLPVLQMLYDPNKQPPELIIDGWNAWFYEDISTLHKVWKHYGKNKQRSGELWIDLLRYYTEIFNWKEDVISIRQHEPLTKLEKLWTTRCIAIEDPFDLSHNLGGGLSRKMNAFILKSFIRGRTVFGTGHLYPPLGYQTLESFLFDKRILTDGAPPNDRGCRWCGRIGHLVKDCPRKQQKKDSQQKENKNSNKKKEKMETLSESTVKVPPPPSKGEPTTPSKPKSEEKLIEDVLSKDVTVSSAKQSSTNDGKIFENKNVLERGVGTPSVRPGDNALISSVKNKVCETSISYNQKISDSVQLPPNTKEKIEISPNQLFQLASNMGVGNSVLPPVPYVNSVSEIPHVPPPGFSARPTNSPSSILSKGMQTNLSSASVRESNHITPNPIIESEIEKIKASLQQSPQPVNPHVQQLQQQLQMQLSQIAQYHGYPLQYNQNLIWQAQQQQKIQQSQMLQRTPQQLYQTQQQTSAHTTQTLQSKQQQFAHSDNIRPTQLNQISNVNPDELQNSQPTRYLKQQALQPQTVQQNQQLPSNTSASDQMYSKFPYKSEGSTMQQPQHIPLASQQQQFIQYKLMQQQQQQLQAKANPQQHQSPSLPLDGNKFISQPLSRSLPVPPQGTSIQNPPQIGGSSWNIFGTSPPLGIAPGQYNVSQQRASPFLSLMQQPQPQPQPQSSTSGIQQPLQMNQGIGNQKALTTENLVRNFHQPSLPSPLMGLVKQNVVTNPGHHLATSVHCQISRDPGSVTSSEKTDIIGEKK